MKNLTQTILILFLASSFLFPAKKIFSAEAKELIKTINQLCTDRELQVQFHCGKDWKIRTADDALIIVIDTNPKVSFLVMKLDSDIKFLGQLTHDILKQNRLYLDGFQTVRMKISGRDILKVKAFSQLEPNKRLWDYYFIQDDQLYGILFSVYPKERAAEYQYIVKEVLENFKFLEVPTNSE